jgi:hypothetical protein
MHGLLGQGKLIRAGALMADFVSRWIGHALRQG